MVSLEFGGRIAEPSVRRVDDMKEVIYDKRWLKSAGNLDLYYMYRDLSLSRRDGEIIKKNHLRYDITIIPPRVLGVEYVKTIGHYHPPLPDAKLSYVEVYEVLNGEAHYLLQKCQNDDVRDVVLIKAERGDKVIIPPDYGHVTINPSNKELRMCNWVARDFSSIYEPIKEKGGAAYFELVIGFVKNENYGNVPELRFLEPTNFSEVGLRKNREMYGLIREDPALLEFLTKPQDYGWLFERVLGDE
ncbi:MAG: glucose-6-phosphate isomerase family protein [Methanocellales archaeon]|nr:glucose-6-phosphate isomerase family protein [Methanocellales archaeon]MDD3291566.1 glucose-6-phosphate isomerase family protein [Methanocellales archaeon]MDD5235856.1 glucose-6-phosphate isomerase family protein [Methanocellales archaeon]MDD5485349.1 glucose-6-phosphate isomerase family protein [Methanocellales archaeon]